MAQQCKSASDTYASIFAPTCSLLTRYSFYKCFFFSTSAVSVAWKNIGLSRPSKWLKTGDEELCRIRWAAAFLCEFGHYWGSQKERIEKLFLLVRNLYLIIGVWLSWMMARGLRLNILVGKIRGAVFMEASCFPIADFAMTSNPENLYSKILWVRIRLPKERETRIYWSCSCYTVRETDGRPSSGISCELFF